MKGYIVKGIGGFYYVKTEEGVIECKPRGIFRKQKITPVAGDEVTLETENGAQSLPRSHPAKTCLSGRCGQFGCVVPCGQHHPAHPQHTGAGQALGHRRGQGGAARHRLHQADLGEVEFLRSAYERSTLPSLPSATTAGKGWTRSGSGSAGGSAPSAATPV